MRQVLELFTWDEVETMVCGKPEVDVKLLQVRVSRMFLSCLVFSC